MKCGEEKHRAGEAMRKLSIACLLVGCLFVSFIVSGQNPGQYIIVVNNSNEVTTISRKDLSKLFLKKKTRWNSGKEVLPVDLLETSRIRDRFSQDIHRRPLAKVKAYWQNQVFSGKRFPPPQFEYERDVLSFVASDSGAIGYISTTTPVDGFDVHIVSITN